MSSVSAFRISKEETMKYINEIKEGEQVVEHYLCKSRQTFKSKNDKNYLSLKLADKTGTVDAKVWNLGNEIQSFSENDMIKIDATAQIFNNEIQSNGRSCDDQTGSSRNQSF